MGISQYLSERDDWSVSHHTGILGAMDLAAIQHWTGDGIIARIANPEIEAIIRSKGVPIIDVLGNVAPQEVPLVKCDDRLIGNQVANHLMEQGHRKFAFLGIEHQSWSQERESGFADSVAKHTGEVYTHYVQLEDHDAPNYLSDEESIIRWIRTLPLPIGLMVASDQLAPIVFEACRMLNCSIPESVSVVGVDNDRPFCNLCRPQLTSIEPNHSGVGYLAAELLNRLVSGDSVENRTYMVNPRRIHVRRSSDTLAVGDPAIRKALHFVRTHACAGTTVDEVAAHAGLSRSVLQRRFRELLKRSVGELILAEKLRRARELLSDTKLSISDIADKSGLNCQEYLNHIFRKHLNTTPRRYRLQHQQP